VHHHAAWTFSNPAEEMSTMPFIWPLNGTSSPDEMNTSYGPRIDADRWDFHDGIDLPAAVGTPVHAMADGTVHRAGPADKTGPGQGFGSTHVLLQVVDPTDGKYDLFLVYLHLDSIADGVSPGAVVHQGDVIGAVGQEDAEYPHLHFEFRKGGPREDDSVHPLHYLPYDNTANVARFGVDRCNFSRVGTDDRRAVRLRFSVQDRREGDVQGVDVELRGKEGAGVEPRHVRVDFDDRAAIVSDKGDEHAFNEQGLAVEGYQKSNMKGEGLSNLQYGVIIKDIAPEFEKVTLQVLDAKNGPPTTAEFPLPTLGAGAQPVNSRVGFESQTFPPRGWTVQALPANVCRPDPVAALSGSRGLLCQDLQSGQGTLIRAGLRFALPVDRLPVRPMSWRLRADIRPVDVQMDKGLEIHPLIFLAGNEVVAAACLRKTRSDELIAGVLIRSANGLFRERIDVIEGEIFRDDPVQWELELLRIGTRHTTAVLRLRNTVIARINGDTSSIEPDAACVGIVHRHGGLQITLHVDQILLTEAL
jgi:Peptidase family M23